jgi:phage shock protein PspC (stress-responsive transcriptional regulator)
VAPAYVPVQEQAAQAGLFRPLQGRAIAGVCAGFAQCYGWDAVAVRLILVAAVLVGCGAPVIGYFIAWIVMPNEPYFMATPVAPMQPPVEPMAQQGQAQA